MTTEVEVIRLCAWCKKHCVDGKWVQIPLLLCEVLNISHGICPECRDKELKNDHPEALLHK
jgi:hypothetical protein